MFMKLHLTLHFFNVFTPDRTMATALRDETRPQIWLTILTWSTVLIMVGGEIFTSSLKIERLVQEERTVLDELKQYIDHQYDRLKDLSRWELKLDLAQPSLYRYICRHCLLGILDSYYFVLRRNLTFPRSQPTHASWPRSFP